MGVFRCFSFFRCVFSFSGFPHFYGKKLFPGSPRISLEAPFWGTSGAISMSPELPGTSVQGKIPGTFAHFSPGSPRISLGGVFLRLSQAISMSPELLGPDFRGCPGTLRFFGAKKVSTLLKKSFLSFGAFRSKKVCFCFENAHLVSFGAFRGKQSLNFMKNAHLSVSVHAGAKKFEFRQRSSFCQFRCMPR